MRNDLKGVSENPVDDKGRVSLPTKYRKPLSGIDLVLVKSNNKEFPYLKLYTEEDYYSWVDDFFVAGGGFLANDQLQELQKLRLIGAAEKVKIDASYRIRFTQDQIKYASIGDRVRFIGAGDYVAIMDIDQADKLIDVPLYAKE